LDEILEGQTDIFDLLGPHELETQPPPIIEKTKQALADKDPS
jgi:hypothetical protein